MPTDSWSATLARLRTSPVPPAAPPPTLHELRRAFSPSGSHLPVPDDVDVSEVSAGGVAARWFRSPGADTAHAVLFLHGGGYCLGSTRSHGELIARVARASGIQVLALDYRLAPEHPFPAAVDDVRAAWLWLRHQQELPARSCAVVGDSAGGGLALSLLVTVGEADEDQPGAVALLSPWTDLTLSGESVTARAEDDPLLTPGLLAHLAGDYLAGADARSPLASPLFADLTGFPPLLVQVGTAEILLSDSERLARSAARAGVEVTLQVEDGAPHVYQSMHEVNRARESTDKIGAFLRHHLVDTTTSADSPSFPPNASHPTARTQS